MKLHFLPCLFCCFLFFNAAGQSILSGAITDKDTGEPLIGATISSGNNGTITDWDGSYSLELKDGKHTISVSYVSFKSTIFEIEMKGNQTLDAQLKPDNVLEEITVTADIAIERETPVAFTNIPTRKLNEELAAQDIPMVLNSTPGAYATESGGGDGDARITIRGFNQRNVAVMLDGIPVNDMENGWVYWSNWFGLELVTQTMQVQRGLGASKLSIPSIGGTINILTKGINAKRSFKFKQEIGNNGYLRSTLGITSGRLKNGWGVSAAASYKQGNGWVDGNFTKGYFYYLRIDKQLGNHLVSLSGFGAPQEHGQRPFTAEVGQVDSTYSVEIGVPDSIISRLDIIDQGRRYNQHWGLKEGEVFNTRKNYYHKPQFSLRHSWQANERFFWSNIAYLSIGNGGGTAYSGATFSTEENQYDIDAAIAANQPSFPFNPEGISNSIIRTSHNNHFWYGLLSTARYTISDLFTLSGGIDARYYKGEHYRTVSNLLGGSGFKDFEGNARLNPDEAILQEDDRITYDYTGFVRWGGMFGMLEFKQRKLSAFINVSSAISGYSMEEHMKAKVVQLADTTFYVGYQRNEEGNYTDSTLYNGKVYTLDSPEAKDQKIDWIDLPSYTLKGGASFKINDNNTVFANTGYISKAQRFSNVLNSNRSGDKILEFQDYKNERIIAFELGYGFKSSIFSANLNGYYTFWENKPLDSPPVVSLDEDGEDRVPVNISGIDALHQGIELDFVLKPIEKITIEGLASVGDWRWTSAEKGSVILPNNILYEYDFDATDVHVGDAAQLQLGGLIRVEPVKNLYFKLKGTYFGNNYANFQPEDLKGENAGRDSWQLPNYYLFSAHAGYSYTIKGVRLGLRANVLNLLDEVYITDARNNDTFNSPAFEDFDAKSASVHYGQGRRYSISLQVSF